MAAILDEVRAGTFPWSIEREDVHFNIEHRLTELVGDAGKRLHTARSRNDQVATDIRLWLRAEIDDARRAAAARCARALLDLAEQHADTLMPGFTHLQVAQPVTFGHHLMAYFEMFSRDAERLADCRKRVNRLPLGASALAGTSFPIDRESVARELGFDGVCENSLDAVSDRDFAIEFLAAAALAMTHLSRLSEELVLWMSPRFGFIDLADRFCTGSSIMPQKKNPDVPELMRGKTGRVYGALVALLTLMKGQPLAYNKDNQEDKEPLFDTADTLRDVLSILRRAARRLEPRPERMRAALRRGLRHRHRPRRLPGAQGRRLPRRARGGGARGARRRGGGQGPLRAAARRAAGVLAADRRRRPRGAHARGLGRLARATSAAPRPRRCARRSRARAPQPGV